MVSSEVKLSQVAAAQAIMQAEVTRGNLDATLLAAAMKEVLGNNGNVQGAIDTAKSQSEAQYLKWAALR